jgi:hypothetical protein
MTIDKVFQELNGKVSQLLKAVPLSPAAKPIKTDPNIPRRVERLFLKGEDGKLKLLQTKEKIKKPPKFGRVLDAHFLSYEGKEEGTVGSSTTRKRKVILRVSILCNSFYRYRLRIMVRRNTRDVDHDGDSDMNPRFLMDSEVSPWVDYGAFTVVRSPSIKNSLPTSLLKLKGDKHSSVTKEDWLKRPIDQSKIIGEFGKPLTTLLNDNKRYWYHWDSSIHHDKLVVALLHLSYHPDRTIPLHRFSAEGKKARNSIRDVFQPCAMALAKIEKLDTLFDVAKKDAPSVSKAFSAKWLYTQPTEEENQVGNSIPILEIQDWPFSWAK